MNNSIKKLVDFISHQNAFIIGLELAIFAGVIFTLAAEDNGNNNELGIINYEQVASSSEQVPLGLASTSEQIPVLPDNTTSSTAEQVGSEGNILGIESQRGGTNIEPPIEQVSESSFSQTEDNSDVTLNEVAKFVKETKKKHPEAIELIDERTENTKKFLIQTFPDGRKQYEGMTSLAPLHYKDNYDDPNEQWKDIDPTVELVDGKMRVTKAPYNLEVLPNKAGFKVTSKKDGSWVELTLEDNPSVTDMTRSGNKVVFADAFSDVDLEITATPMGVTLFEKIKAPINKTFTYAVKEKMGDTKFLDDVSARTPEMFRVPASQTKHNIQTIGDYKQYNRTEKFELKAYKKNEEQALTYPIVMDATVSVGAASDDWYDSTAFIGSATDDGGGTAANLYIGRVSSADVFTGFRFLNLNITSGSTINTMTMTTVSSGWDGTALNASTSIEKTLAPVTFSIGAPPSTRASTTAEVTYALSDVPGAVNTTPSLVAAAQEAVNADGGMTHCVVITKGATTDTFKIVAAYGNTSYAVAALTYTYTAGAAAPAASYQPRPGIISPSGGGFLSF